MLVFLSLSLLLLVIRYSSSSSINNIRWYMSVLELEADKLRYQVGFKLVKCMCVCIYIYNVCKSRGFEFEFIAL